MNAGGLDERITIKTLTSSSIDLNGDVIDYYTSSSLWCNAKSETGDESVSNEVANVVSRYTFTIRYNNSVTESSNVVYNGYPYNIRYIESPFGRTQWSKLHCERQIGTQNGR